MIIICVRERNNYTSDPLANTVLMVSPILGSSIIVSKSVRLSGVKLAQDEQRASASRMTIRTVSIYLKNKFDF